jgi:hypothetical protein
MPGVGFGKIARFLTLFALASVAALHLTGTIKSASLFAGVIIIAVAIIAFQTGMQYSELRHS